MRFTCLGMQPKYVIVRTSNRYDLTTHLSVMGRIEGKEGHLRMGHWEDQGSTSDMTFLNLNLLVSLLPPFHTNSRINNSASCPTKRSIIFRNCHQKSAMIWELCLPYRVAQVDPCDTFFRSGCNPGGMCYTSIGPRNVAIIGIDLNTTSVKIK